MIIAQISDTHITLDAPDADQRIRDFEAVIADINALDPAPDIIIHSGDIVHNGLREEYSKALEILSKAHAPVYGMVGNKDDRAMMRSVFSDADYMTTNSDFIEYVIDDFPIKLIILDTKHANNNLGDFCSVRMRNLGDMINTEATKPIAVFTHHPPCEVTVGPHPMHFESMQTMNNLRQVLKDCGRVIGVFCGHVHRATVGYIEDIPVTVMSAVATPLRRDDYPNHMKNCPIYNIHRLDENGDLITEKRVVSG
ncbi:MAG: metallophosphoesterase [Hyphomicrobiales bacterium]